MTLAAVPAAAELSCANVVTIIAAPLPPPVVPPDADAHPVGVASHVVGVHVMPAVLASPTGGTTVPASRGAPASGRAPPVPTAPPVPAAPPVPVAPPAPTEPPLPAEVP